MLLLLAVVADDPVRRRARGCSRRALWRARCEHALDGADALRRRRDRPVRDRPPLRARRSPSSATTATGAAPRSASPTPTTCSGARRCSRCSAASPTGGRRSSAGSSARGSRVARPCCSSSASTARSSSSSCSATRASRRARSSFGEHGSTSAYNMISTIGACRDRRRRPALPARGRAGAQRQARRQRPVARRHARVVHDLAAAGAQLRLRCRRSRARGRSHDLRRTLKERNAL